MAATSLEDFPPLINPNTSPKAPDPPIINHNISFADMARSKNADHPSKMQQPLLPVIPIAPKIPSTYEGAPAITFSQVEVNQASLCFSNTLIAKFSAGRPTVAAIRDHIRTWGLKEEATVGLIDPRHVMIRLKSQDDFVKSWARDSHAIGSSLFRLFKWTPELSPRYDSSFAAVWIRLPYLPLPLFNVSFLKEIAGCIGGFLKADNNTIGLLHPAFARLSVEVNLNDSLPSRIWIQMGPDSGFWQKIVYEGNINYCTKCRLRGHDYRNCNKIFEGNETGKKAISTDNNTLNDKNRNGNDQPINGTRNNQRDNFQGKINNIAHPKQKMQYQVKDNNKRASNKSKEIASFDNIDTSYSQEEIVNNVDVNNTHETPIVEGDLLETNKLNCDVFRFDSIKLDKNVEKEIPENGNKEITKNGNDNDNLGSRMNDDKKEERKSEDKGENGKEDEDTDEDSDEPDELNIIREENGSNLVIEPYTSYSEIVVRLKKFIGENDDDNPENIIDYVKDYAKESWRSKANFHDLWMALEAVKLAECPSTSIDSSTADSGWQSVNSKKNRK